MKRITVLCLLVLICKFTIAQTITISGTVTDQKGAPVSFAFIKDAQHSYQTFSGPDGTFTLNADPSSRLLATSSNYKESVVPIDNKTDIQIVMTSNGTSNTTESNSKTATNTFQIQEIGGTDRAARPLAHFGTAQDELHGSPYLFDHWVHGYAISPQDSVIENSNYLFNYEKISGILLYTDDGKTTYAVYKDKAKQFVLYDDNAQQYYFEDVPAIDDKHYVQVLASGSKYKIYKQLGTEFVKADFQTNGITSSGNNYDSYVDESVYYIVKLPGGQPQKISFKRKSIKAAFGTEADKADKYMSDHSDDISDAYLSSLGDYMNN